MVAPSLVDGRPNCMLEAMAAGAVPIVSPIASICEVVAERQNVFFAHNLAIDEIAKALLSGMTEDALVDAMAQRNLVLVREIAGGPLWPVVDDAVRQRGAEPRPGRPVARCVLYPYRSRVPGAVGVVSAGNHRISAQNLHPRQSYGSAPSPGPSNRNSGQSTRLS